MCAKKARVPLNAEQTGLNAGAFTGLDLAGLPAGPATPPEPAQGTPQPPAQLGRVVLRKETAHRGGKAVIVVDAFAAHLADDFISDLGRRLRNGCGCGGTVRERTIELQQEHPAKVRQLLEKEGFRVAGVS